MRLAFAILFVLLNTNILWSQSSPENVDKLSTRIARIENNLQPSLQISGQPVKSFNIDDRLSELRIPGLSIAVVNNGKLEWAKGYGLADISTGRKVDEKTMFLAGSISKPIAALRIHQLAEAGTIDLDSDVNAYLTSWKVPENEFTVKEKVTLRRILNHTAGLTVSGFPGYHKGDNIPSSVDILDGKGNTEPVRVFREPGSAWQYSGGGYTIVQLLTTDVEKTTFPNLMNQHVLQPLGMDESTFENPLSKKYHSIAATGYRTTGKEVEGKWPIYPEMAAAGLWTTPSQLIQYAIEIQKIKRTRKGGVLKLASVEQMLVPGKNGFGLGPQTTQHTFGHGGVDEGFQAKLVAWKNLDCAVVVMVNTNNQRILDEILQAIAVEYKLPGFEPIIKTVSSLDATERARFEGTYDHPLMGQIVCKIKDAGLEFSFANGADPVFYLPESKLDFFNHATGREIRFETDGETVTGLEIVSNKTKAKKIDPN